MDKLYLHSELLWRQGRLPGAMEALHNALASTPESRKCMERLTFLQPLAAELQQASLAMDSGQSSCDICGLSISQGRVSTSSQGRVSTSSQCSPAIACTGDLRACEEGCSRALQGIRGCGCSGLRSLILTQRASCQLQQGGLQGALGDCCAALAAEPGSPDALHLRYRVGSLKWQPKQLPRSDLCIRLLPVLCAKLLQPASCLFSWAPFVRMFSGIDEAVCKGSA